MTRLHAVFAHGKQQSTSYVCVCVYSFITDIWLICNPVTKLHVLCNCTCM